MQKLAFYFTALFVLFFACTQEQSSEPANDSSTTTTPIIKNDAADKSARPVEQAPAEDLVYPTTFEDYDIPMYANAELENNIMLSNSKGKFGQRIALNCPGTFDDVFNFYDKALTKNGWVLNTTTEKKKQDEDFQYYSSIYERDNFTFLFSIIDLKQGQVKVNQILKEQ